MVRALFVQFLIGSSLTDEEDIYFFGFSRGAYVARFLAEMLDYVGLLGAGMEEMVGDPKTYSWASSSREIAYGYRLGLRGKHSLSGNSGNQKIMRRRRKWPTS